MVFHRLEDPASSCAILARSAMYKIRLYVVPELDQEESTDGRGSPEHFVVHGFKSPSINRSTVTRSESTKDKFDVLRDKFEIIKETKDDRRNSVDPRRRNSGSYRKKLSDIENGNVNNGGRADFKSVDESLNNNEMNLRTITQRTSTVLMSDRRHGYRQSRQNVTGKENDTQAQVQARLNAQLKAHIQAKIQAQVEVGSGVDHVCHCTDVQDAALKRSKATLEQTDSHDRCLRHKRTKTPKTVRVRKRGEEYEETDTEQGQKSLTLRKKTDDLKGQSAALKGGNKICARNCGEYDLEQKIEVEIKMREGSARLLAAARHRAQSLEAARALLTSNERMTTYMDELQRRKRDPLKKSTTTGSTARLSISELRIPLMWRDSDHFKNRGDYRRFAVFCLARVGTEIHDTALLCPVDRLHTDISFPDVLLFNNVPANFELTLEIYSHVLQEDLSIASTPRRIKRTIHSSISKTVGKKLAASLRDELHSGKIGPHFELMASARLTLDDTDNNIRTHDLIVHHFENKQRILPLFGHFCCRLAVQPDCLSKEICTGNVSMNGRRYWARLRGFALEMWDSRKLADEDQKPAHRIPINKDTFVQQSKSAPKELRIIHRTDGIERMNMIKLESNDEVQKWLRYLQNHIQDHVRWRHAAESLQCVPCAESARNSFISSKRQGSLYDETPLIESIPSTDCLPESGIGGGMQQMQQALGLTPSTSLSSCSSNNSPPSLRSRSSSTSGPRKLSTAAALKSHWPFSNKNHE